MFAPFEHRAEGNRMVGILNRCLLTPQNLTESRISAALSGLTPLQSGLFRRYIYAGGQLSSIMGARGVGKTYLLAVIAAAELYQGSIVSYRFMDRYYDKRCNEFWSVLESIVGDTASLYAKNDKLLFLRNPVSGYPVDVDLQDEPWLAPMTHLHVKRYARLGSLPENVIVVGHTENLATRQFLDDNPNIDSVGMLRHSPRVSPRITNLCSEVNKVVPKAPTDDDTQPEFVVG